jgi:signal peptidase II
VNDRAVRVRGLEDQMQMLKRLLLIMTILVSCVGCDQTTKSIAKAYLSETEAVSILGGSVRLQIAKNYGAFLSLGASMHPVTRTALLSAGVAAVLVALFAYGIAAAPRNPLVLPALGMVIGGGVSNLMDRLLHAGYVVDFLNVGIGPVRTGIFNVADVLIMTGVLLLVFSDWISKELLAARYP